MAWNVMVKVRGTNDTIISPTPMDEDKADAQLAEIRSVIGKLETPNIDRLVVVGRDIMSAHKYESTAEGASVAQWE